MAALWATARLLLTSSARCGPVRTPFAFKTRKTNKFNMLLKRLIWQKDSGWSAPWPTGIDSPSTLAVMFGGNPLDGCRGAIAEVARRLPTSVLLGCSTAGEIFDARVQDVSLSVAVARFDEVTLRKASLPTSLAGVVLEDAVHSRAVAFVANGTSDSPGPVGALLLRVRFVVTSVGLACFCCCRRASASALLSR